MYGRLLVKKTGSFYVNSIFQNINILIMFFLSQQSRVLRTEDKDLSFNFPFSPLWGTEFQLPLRKFEEIGKKNYSFLLNKGICWTRLECLHNDYNTYCSVLTTSYVSSVCIKMHKHNTNWLKSHRGLHFQVNHWSLNIQQYCKHQCFTNLFQDILIITLSSMSVVYANGFKSNKTRGCNIKTQCFAR